MNYNYYSYHTNEPYNRDFVEKINDVIEDYFSPEKTDADSYITIGDYNVTMAEKFTTNGGKNQKNFSNALEIENSLFHPDFSNYEKMLFSHFFFGEMHTYVISGAMGSGKSTTINYIMNKSLELELYKDTLYIKMDFSKGYTTLNNSVDELTLYFIEDLYDKLKAELIEKIHCFNLATDFLRFVRVQRQEYSKFYDLQFEKIENSYPTWNSLDERQKVYEIFNYIEQKVNRNKEEMRITMVMYFLKFVSDILHKKNIKVILFYDNIDKLPPVVQRNIITKIFSYNEIANVTKIITARRSTKAKLDKILRDTNPLFSSRAQYVYGHIYHHGPSTTKLYLIKLDFLISNIHKIKLFSFLSNNERECIVMRATEVREKLQNKNSLFRQAYYCISGESNRLGLTLAKRPFCQNIIPYDERSANQQSLIRTLYVGLNKYNRMPIEDMYVANLFSDSDHCFTIINILILLLVEKFNNEAQYEKYNGVAHIYDILFNLFEYRSFEILAALNYLLSDKRALIGCEHFPMYRDENQIRINDQLRITELGDRYLNHLYDSGSIYIQTSLLSLCWPTNYNKQVVHDTIAERFKDLRECLFYIKDEEDYRMGMFKFNAKKESNLKLAIRSINIHITKVVANAFISVLSSLDTSKSHLKEEIRNWYDKLVYLNNDYKDFYFEIDALEKILEAGNKR